MQELIDELRRYLAEPPDAKYEREFVTAKIRPLPVPERVALLQEALALDIPLGLKLAVRSLGQVTYQNEILYPGVLQADPATLREYLVYGMCSGDVLHCIRAAWPLSKTDPERATSIIYYLAVFMGAGGTACQEGTRVWLERLTASGHLDFDPETWEGGLDDWDWFLWLDGPCHWIWWPPVRQGIDRRIGPTDDDKFDRYRWNPWRTDIVRPRARYRPPSER